MSMGAMGVLGGGGGSLSLSALILGWVGWRERGHTAQTP